MQEYIRVRKDEYEELKQIKEGIETIKGYGLPDDTQFVLLTKEDFDRNQKQYEVLHNTKTKEKLDMIIDYLEPHSLIYDYDKKIKEDILDILGLLERLGE